MSRERQTGTKLPLPPTQSPRKFQPTWRATNREQIPPPKISKKLSTLKEFNKVIYWKFSGKQTSHKLDQTDSNLSAARKNFKRCVTNSEGPVHNFRCPLIDAKVFFNHHHTQFSDAVTKIKRRCPVNKHPLLSFLDSILLYSASQVTLFCCYFIACIGRRHARPHLVEGAAGTACPASSALPAWRSTASAATTQTREATVKTGFRNTKN